jgi:hypothetical protein
MFPGISFEVTMTRTALALVASLLLAGGAAAPAVAGLAAIGLYFDPDCAACGLRVPAPGFPFDLYVNAALGAGLWEDRSVSPPKRSICEPTRC